MSHINQSETIVMDNIERYETSIRYKLLFNVFSRVVILDRLEYCNRSSGYHHHKQIKQCNTKQNNYSNIPIGLSRIILATYNKSIVLLYRMSSVDLKFIFEKYGYCCSKILFMFGHSKNK